MRDAAVETADSREATPARERGEILRRSFDLLQKRSDDLALLMTMKMGKTLGKSVGEGACRGEYLRGFGKEASNAKGLVWANPENTGRFFTQYPGAVLLVTPWNFPLAMTTRKIAPALAAGLRVAVRPPIDPVDDTSATTILQEAGR
ncbi:aldehyde dehydrogenase family protein [Rhodococcus sp. NPDC060176]|uniref:aldehyde dehydrogenase family protein n=1 Tax=Rhodococcus sp. NPDC060176 TaxID=3347062 RepID=UPI0036642B63